jgi:acetyl esterase
MADDLDGLDPEAAELVRAMRAQPGPPIDAVPLPLLRALYRDKWRALGGPAPPMAEARDLDAPVPARLLRPHAAPAGNAPCLLAVHGGGYVLGDLDSHDHLWRQIAEAAGIAVVAIDYRHAPEHPYPAAAQDVQAGLAWLRVAAPALGLDPARLAIGGDSGGATLAAVAALADRGAAPKLAAQLLIYPATDAASPNETYPSRRQNAKLPPLDRTASRFFLESYLPDAARRAEWQASPLLAASHAGLPPTLLIAAGRDPLRDEGLAYAEALRRAGVSVDLDEYPGQIHGFLEFTGRLAAARRAVAAIAAWLAARLLTSAGRTPPSAAAGPARTAPSSARR